MEEMLVTWRTGSPTGKEVFGVASQLMLERSIWGGVDASTSGSNNVSTSGQFCTKPLIDSYVQVSPPSSSPNGDEVAGSR